MKKLFLSLTIGLVLSVLLLPVGIVQAAEINPDPSTYGYGSTSEYSPAVTTNTQSSTSLANTGDAQNIVMIVMCILVAVGCIGLLIWRDQYVAHSNRVLGE